MNDIKKLWTGKERRHYRNIKSGLYRSFMMGADVRFLTLTTSDEMVKSEGYNRITSLYEDFRCLKGRIRRLKPIQLVHDGYMSHSKAMKFYGQDNLYKSMKFEYWKVNTNEGNGVVHCLYRGSFIPTRWLSDVWRELHKSPIVKIKLVRDSVDDIRRLSSYCVNQYLANQDCSYTHQSQSLDWIFRGSAEAWKCVVDRHKNWNDCYIDKYKRKVPKIDWKGVYLDWNDVIGRYCFAVGKFSNFVPVWRYAMGLFGNQLELDVNVWG